MNYSAIYERLIARARGRALEGYRERHHVVPRCLGGGNEPENIVELTSEEHYVAHQLLVKIHRARGLAYAAMKMAKRATDRRAFGWLRRKAAADMIGHSYSAGIPKSAEWKAKMSARQKGREKSDAERANIAAAKRGKPAHPNTVAKLKAANLGNTYRRGTKLSDSARAAISAAQIGRKRKLHTDETKARIAAAKRGRKLSSEHREKIGAALRGRRHSVEHVLKQAAAQSATKRTRAAALRGAVG